MTGLGEIPLDSGDALLVNANWPDQIRLRDDGKDLILPTLPEEFHDVALPRRKASRALVIIAAMVATMVSGWIPSVTTVLRAAVLLLFCGCVKREAIYGAIRWQAVVLIAGILPLATALDKSGAARMLSENLVNTLATWARWQC